MKYSSFDRTWSLKGVWASGKIAAIRLVSAATATEPEWVANLYLLDETACELITQLQALQEANNWALSRIDWPDLEKPHNLIFHQLPLSTFDQAAREVRISLLSPAPGTPRGHTVVDLLMTSNEAMDLLGALTGAATKGAWKIWPRNKRPDFGWKSAAAQRFPSVGKCIYCGSTDSLSDEHIIPLSLGGNFILPEASCRTCAEKTSRFERYCARSIYGPVRYDLRFPSRKKGREWPKSLPAEFIFHGGRVEVREIPLEDYPQSRIPLIEFGGPPEIVLGKPPGLEWGPLRVAWIWLNYEGDVERSRKVLLGSGAASVRMSASIEFGPYAQLLAKIAHGYAVGEFGIDSFFPLLPKYIVGGDKTFPFVVGGAPEDIVPKEPLDAFEHAVAARLVPLPSGELCLTAIIKLFGFANAPTNWVAVGIAKPSLVSKFQSLALRQAVASGVEPG